jgi:hypothetical protein
MMLTFAATGDTASCAMVLQQLVGEYELLQNSLTWRNACRFNRFHPYRRALLIADWVS